MKMTHSLSLLGLLFLAMGCTSLPASGYPYSQAVAPEKVPAFGYLFSTFNYSQKPVGYNRYFGIDVVPDSSSGLASFVLPFNDKDHPGPVLFKLIPGDYTIAAVEYLGYSYRTVNLKVKVEANQVYYLGHYDIINVKKTTMTETGVFISLVDSLAASSGNWDYTLTNNLAADSASLAAAYPELAGYPVHPVLPAEAPAQ